MIQPTDSYVSFKLTPPTPLAPVSVFLFEMFDAWTFETVDLSESQWF